MSARRLPKRSDATLDKRREELRRQVGDDKITDEQATRMIRARMSWWEWFVEDYARYWYFIGAAALDIFLGLGLAQTYHMDDALGIFILSVMVIMLCAGEYVLFKRLWPDLPPFEDMD